MQCMNTATLNQEEDEAQQRNGADSDLWLWDDRHAIWVPWVAGDWEETQPGVRGVDEW